MNMPIDMVLHCPACGLQHIDSQEPGPLMFDQMDHAPKVWKNPPHESHFCYGCGHIWRPADVPTNGVRAIKTRGTTDSPVLSGPRVAAPPVAAEPAKLFNMTVTIDPALAAGTVEFRDKDGKLLGRAVNAATPAAQRPLSVRLLSELAREAQVDYCLDKAPSWEVALARRIEAAHGITTDGTDK